VNSRDQSDLYSGIYCGIFTNDYSANAGQVMMTKITKTEGEWKACLTPEQFEITRKHGTERAFSGPHQNEKRAGIFKCVGCDNPLFDCHTKYDTGTGRPSFLRQLMTTESANTMVTDGFPGARKFDVQNAIPISVMCLVTDRNQLVNDIA
jgi:hypothetical protein